MDSNLKTTTEPNVKELQLTLSPKHEMFQASYDQFLTFVSKLALEFGTPRTTIIKTLIDNPCLVRAHREVRHPKFTSDQKFDSYFSLKHEFGRNKFVQRLVLALGQLGITATITTESKNVAGVFDVLIINGKYLLSVSDKAGKKKIIIEWKSGASFSLSQLERYLWEADVVVLVRVPVMQAVKLARKDVEDYLNTSILALLEQAHIVAANSGNLQKIPGTYCSDCPVFECEFRRQNASGRMVVLKNETMEEDLKTAFTNLDGCITKAIDIVVKELQS